MDLLSAAWRASPATGAAFSQVVGPWLLAKLPGTL
jgi:hypothetical protein